LSQGVCRLRIHVPVACPLFVAFSVNATRLPQMLRLHERIVLEALEKGGTLEIVDPKGTDGNPHGMDLKAWSKVFPDLDLERSWEGTLGTPAGMEALVGGKTMARNAWEGDPCYTLPDLRKSLAEGRSFADIVAELDHGCPSYPIGPARLRLVL
jgi:hypothetical protein